jgi:hypothetical protein
VVCSCKEKEKPNTLAEIRQTKESKTKINNKLIK